MALAVHFGGQSSGLPERVPSTTPTTSGSSSAPPPGADPAAVVRAYYTAINNGDIAKAWALGRMNLGKSFETFVAGFAQDSNIGITNLTSAGNTVTAKAKEVELDGVTEVVNLTYTVVNGVITAVTEHTS